MTAKAETVQPEQEEPKRWTPPIHGPSGLPLAMKTPGGKVLPLMVMDRRNHHIKWCKDKPCKQRDHWETLYSNYLQVAHRLVWFREERPTASIVTEFLTLTDQEAVCVAKIISDGLILGMGHKKETARSFSDFMEKAETGAAGRALAMCGYGTQFSPDLDEGQRLADTPTTTGKEAAPLGGQGDHDGQASSAGAEKASPEPAEVSTQHTRSSKWPRIRQKLLGLATTAGCIGPQEGDLTLSADLARDIGRGDGRNALQVNVDDLTEPEAATLGGRLTSLMKTLDANKQAQAEAASLLKD
jgi:hypothetical protein